MTELADGLHSLTREAYDAIERVNFSTLKWMARSPAHYRHHLIVKDGADTDARLRGRAVSAATFEPERFKRAFVVWTGGARRGDEWKEFEVEHATREILPERLYEEVLAISAAVRASAMAAPYLSGGKGEQTLIWKHKVEPISAVAGYEILCKGRLDFIAKAFGGCIVDLKNARDGSPEGMERACIQYGTHIQAAYYQDGFFAALGQRMPFKIVAVEPDAPYVAQVYTVPDELLEIGRDTYRGWLDRLNHCRTFSEWPGYATSEMNLSLPRWAMPAEDENDLSELGLT